MFKLIKYETDSRKIKKGQTFVAIKGYTVDGHDYVNSAIKNGASHIIAEKKLDVDVPVTVVENSAKYFQELLVKEYSKMFKSLKLISQFYKHKLLFFIIFWHSYYPKMN